MKVIEQYQDLSDELTSTLDAFTASLPAEWSRLWCRVDAFSSDAFPLSISSSIGSRLTGDELAVVSIAARWQAGMLVFGIDLCRGDGLVLAEGPELSATGPEDPALSRLRELLEGFLGLIQDEVVAELR